MAFSPETPAFLCLCIGRFFNVHLLFVLSLPLIMVQEPWLCKDAAPHVTNGFRRLSFAMRLCRKTKHILSATVIVVKVRIMFIYAFVVNKLLKVIS